MTTYELVNPHDPYVFDAPDNDIATAVVTVLGQFYGWQILGTNQTGGMLGFGGRDAEVEQLNVTLTERMGEVARALRTLVRTNPERSSLTDLLAEAADMATRIERHVHV